MASRVKLETHEIQFFVRNSRHTKPLNLWNLDGGGLRIGDVFLEYLEWLDHREFADEQEQKVFAFEKSPDEEGIERYGELNPDSEFQSGRFEYGEYGITNMIKDVRTKRKQYRKTIGDAEVYPLYFLLYAPEGEESGLFVLQRYGNIAMLTQLKKSFSEFLRERFDFLTATIKPLIPVPILRGFIEHGIAEEVILTRKDIPDDEADRLMEGGLATKPDGIVVRITGESIIEKETMLEWLENGQASYVVEDLAKVGLDGNHKTSVLLDVHGTPRLIDFSDTGKIRPYVDIHSDELLDRNTKHPIFTEINRIAKEHAKVILKPDH